MGLRRVYVEGYGVVCVDNGRGYVPRPEANVLLGMQPGGGHDSRHCKCDSFHIIWI